MVGELVIVAHSGSMRASALKPLVRSMSLPLQPALKALGYADRYCAMAGETARPSPIARLSAKATRRNRKHFRIDVFTVSSSLCPQNCRGLRFRPPEKVLGGNERRWGTRRGKKLNDFLGF